MNAILDIMNPTRWLMLGAMVLALALGALKLVDHIGDVREVEVVARYEKAITGQKLQAAATLAVAVQKNAVLERDLQTMTNQLEVLDEQRNEITQGYERRLTALAARNGGRLRDPNATGCRDSGGDAKGAPVGGAGQGDSGGAQTGGLLSLPLSDLLGRIVRESDEINDAYAICKPWSIGTEKRVNAEVKP